MAFAALALVAGNALSLPGRRMLGHYDFGYAIRGDRAARPVQVFDDGTGKIFFTLRPGQPMPAVFVGHTPVLLVMQPEGQYFTARTGESEFTLALGAARATVRRGDGALGPEAVSWGEDEPGEPEIRKRDGAADRLLASAAAGLPAGIDFDPGTPTLEASRPTRVARHEQPVVFPAGSAVLKPEVREALGALVVRIGRDTPIAVTGRNDSGEQDVLARRRAEALRNALLARGVPARRLDIVTESPDGSSQAPPHPRASTLSWRTPADDVQPAAEEPFDIRPTDHDLGATLARWARASGYEIVWDVPWTAPPDVALQVEAPDFLDAVRQVVTGLRSQGHAIRAQAYSDRVVRFSAAP